MPVHLVFCSCPDPAHHLATTLVAQQLTACVSQLPPMHSLYRRQGTVEQADEVLLAKTPAGCLPWWSACAPCPRTNSPRSSRSKPGPA